MKKQKNDKIFSFCNKSKATRTEASVLSAHLGSVSPKDKNLIIKSVKKTKKVLILDKFNFHSGLANICINLLKDLCNIKIESISINDFIHDYGSYENLKNKAGFSQKNIMLKISKLFR